MVNYCGTRRISYYDFAENDYLYLKNSYERSDFSNAMAVLTQSICERFFGSSASVDCQNTPQDEIADALRTYSTYHGVPQQR